MEIETLNIDEIKNDLEIAEESWIEKENKQEELSNLSLTVENSINLEEEQKSFLDTTVGKVINEGLEIGLRMILPDFIENQIIELKDALIQEGLSGLKNSFVNQAINTGKSAIGIVTGEFDNISQVQSAIQKGGLIDSISSGIDYGLKFITDKKIIPSSIARIIKQRKKYFIK